MESDISQAFQKELTCFICLSCLTDPVTISCGHSFCQACLHLSWEDIQLPVQCPMCREPSQKKGLRTNIVLKKLVSIARQTSLMKDLSSEEHKCVTHKEAKRIFCAEKRIFLCQLCSNSHEHRGHRHCPIEAAAEDQMDRLLKQMASLWEKIQENQENIEAENRMITRWMEYLTLREEMIRTEYRKLHPLLCEEEEKHIECMRNKSQCVLEKLRTSEAMMVQKNKELRKIYQELMAMSQEPYVVLLQGLDDVFRRSESMQLSMPQTTNPELNALPITGLSESYKQFQVHIFFENTIVFHHKMNILNAMRRFIFRPHHNDTSAVSAGCYFASWRSKNSFTSGKYYWELDLKDSWDWAVGVCKDSWLRSRNQLIEYEGAFLLVCVKENSHYSLLTTCPVFQHYIEKPIGRVGVLLDCVDGSLSFLNVAKSSLIYRYPPGTFNYQVKPFFLTGYTWS
ncbi:tripartite motif-containing protein 43-like [Peromyscus californicus insignis]|uniref:tripartite motif-containing protein 43-like n=1 Tax=Peromyscus californicus insignis TaxID=564181 RepID=UPI0022A73EE5|nr:tripartite motif-containing protein 43-like [Peromyscus californicus insignis]XP_052585512.1 tripartite motif-containing protein 43-like [Peromyscus californicus insignis]